jgi:hypothetical protein
MAVTLQLYAPADTNIPQGRTASFSRMEELEAALPSEILAPV